MWLNNEGDEEYFRRQFDHIRSVNNKCDSMIKVFGLLKYENRLYVITEFARAIRNNYGLTIEPTIDEIISASVDSYKAAIEYDFKIIQPHVDFELSVLQEQRRHGSDHYQIDKIIDYIENVNEEVIQWLLRWNEYFATNTKFEENYKELFGFIHRDIHKGNIIPTIEGPRLIDFEIAAVDNRLFDLTRPLVIFTDPNIFEDAVRKMKYKANEYMTEMDKELFDRVMILDILTCNGYEIGQLPITKDLRIKEMLVKMISERLAYSEILMKNMKSYNLDYI